MCVYSRRRNNEPLYIYLLWFFMVLDSFAVNTEKSLNSLFNANVILHHRTIDPIFFFVISGAECKSWSESSVHREILHIMVGGGQSDWFMHYGSCHQSRQQWKMEKWKKYNSNVATSCCNYNNAMTEGHFL